MPVVIGDGILTRVSQTHWSPETLILYLAEMSTQIYPTAITVELLEEYTNHPYVYKICHEGGFGMGWVGVGERSYLIGFVCSFGFLRHENRCVYAAKHITCRTGGHCRI